MFILDGVADGVLVFLRGYHGSLVHTQGNSAPWGELCYH